MGALNTPFGMRALRHPTGAVRAVRGVIASGAAAMFKNTPVRLSATGTLTPAAAGETLLGGFVGCEYTSGGRRIIQNFWPNGTVSSDAIGWYYDDAEVVYAIQADGSVDLADIGSHADFTSAGTGSTLTGISTTTITATPVVSGTAQVQVIGLYEVEGNAWGDAFTVVEVKIAEHQLAGNRGTAY